MELIHYDIAGDLTVCLMARYHNVNVGVAVQTEHGLMVPVVKVTLHSFYMVLLLERGMHTMH
jgi:hypothetical protein